MSTPAQTLRPPAPPGPITWVRQNLFSSWFNSILTILTLLLIIVALRAVLYWLIIVADWSPVTEYFLLFMVGQYPQDMVWRVGLSLALVCFLFGVSWGVGGELIQSFAITIGTLLALAPSLPGFHPGQSKICSRPLPGYCVVGGVNYYYFCPAARDQLY